MSYKYLGRTMQVSCTPAPWTPYDNRSCRERTGCTKECNPKTLKCDKCGEMFSGLNYLENTETNEKIYVCNGCERVLKEDNQIEYFKEMV